MKANLANRPSIERVREMVAYDPETGVLTWRVTSGRAIAGREAGGIDKSTGYHRVRIDGQIMLSHHVAWAWMTGEWPTQLDHVYGKSVGNGWWNLRESTQSQNIANIGKLSTNTSGFKGAHFHKDTGRWQAQIRVNKKTIYLGLYFTKEEAAEAYAAAAIKHFGEFARTEDMPRRQNKPAIAKREKGRPSVDEVREHLSYDPETGLIRWKKALGFRGVVGEVAGRVNPDGYVRIGLFGKQYPGHVLAWVIVEGVWPTQKIDHKNNVRGDNRWENLREGTQSQNIANAVMSTRNTSGYRGVSFIKSTGEWGAWIKVQGKSSFLGRYSTPEQAHESYCRAARAAFGEFARTD